jgi:hypothetical protein
VLRAPDFKAVLVPMMQKVVINLRCFALLLCIFLFCSFPLFSYAESIASAIPTASNSDKLPLEKVRLQLKWFHQFQFAVYYSAIEQGYYAEEGLDVELIERDLNKSVKWVALIPVKSEQVS